MKRNLLFTLLGSIFVFGTLVPHVYAAAVQVPIDVNILGGGQGYKIFEDTAA